MQSAALLAAVTTLARRAGVEILSVYSQSFEVTHKADQSPLTLADMRAHHVIVQGLRELTPEIPVLSEEDSDIPYEERRRWARYWLVDPLDGTKEFVSRNGEFTVNIALIEDHAPVLGVVHVPVSDTTYAGEIRSGAVRQIGAEPAVRINVCVPAPETPRVVGSRSHGVDLSQHLPQLGPHTLLSIGSSLKFCLIAEGSADFYPRFGPTSEWDTAAAQAVVEAAGGAVVKSNGEALRYNLKADLLNPHFFAFGDKTRNWLQGITKSSA
jgi:3'(2'), 5'-bisphosphate nucleotidase